MAERRVLVAAACLAALVMAAAARAQYVFVDLGPSATGSDAREAVAGVQGGYVMDEVTLRRRATIWYGTAASRVSLHNDAWNETMLDGLDQGLQSGAGWNDSTSSSFYHALLWSGTPDSLVDLHPTGPDTGSAVTGADSGWQVGNTYTSPGQGYRAWLWHGTAASAVELTPAGAYDAYVWDIRNGQQVGYVDSGGLQYAAVWTGSAASCMSLHPAGYANSSADSTDGTHQVGFVGAGTPHAAYWSGTAASFVDLHPGGDFQWSYAFGVANGVQVGQGYKSGNAYYALAWQGTPQSCVVLNDFMPAGYRDAWAESIDAYGNISGHAGAPDGFYHACLWRPSRAATNVTVPSVAGGPGQQATLSAALQLVSSGAALAGETIHFIVNQREVGTAVTDASGVATLSYTLPGTCSTQSLACAFAGDGSAAASCGTARVSAKTATRVYAPGVPGPAGGSALISAWLLKADKSAYIAGKLLTFTVNGLPAGSGTTDSSGRVNLSVPVPQGATGTIPFAVAFTDADDPDYLTASTSGSISVVQTPPTRVIVSPTSGAVGENVRFVAWLLLADKSGYLAGKTLAFKVGSTTIGSGVTDATGKAQVYWTIPSGLPSPQTISTTFGGDQSYAASSGTGTLAIGGKIPTRVYLTDQTGTAGTTTSLVAWLLKADKTAYIEGKVLHFLVDGSEVATAATDSTGKARCLPAIPPGWTGTQHSLSVSFTDTLDPGYATSSGSAQLNVQ